jgi:hypothetical protein
MSEIIDKPDSYQAFLLDDATKSKWYRIVFDLKKQFGKKPDMNGILFLIGMRELGQLREFANYLATKVIMNCNQPMKTAGHIIK